MCKVFIEFSLNTMFFFILKCHDANQVQSEDSSTLGGSTEALFA